MSIRVKVFNRTFRAFPLTRGWWWSPSCPSIIIKCSASLWEKAWSWIANLKLLIKVAFLQWEWKTRFSVGSHCRIDVKYVHVCLSIRQRSDSLLSLSMALIVDRNLSLVACTSWCRMCLSVYIDVNKLVQIHEGKRRGIRIVEFRDSPPTTRQIRLEDRSELLRTTTIKITCTIWQWEWECVCVCVCVCVREKEREREKNVAYFLLSVVRTQRNFDDLYQSRARFLCSMRATLL